MLLPLRRLFARKPKRPFHLLQVEPTMRCNLRCIMCPWPAFRAPADMSWATYQRIVPYLSLAQELDLTGGGESLLHPRLLDMVLLGKIAGCVVGFSTNATLLKPDVAYDLVLAGLDWIAYSVDGATRTTYESIRVGARFQTVLDNIQAMWEARRARHSITPHTMIFFVMMRQNFHELPQMVELAHRLGIEQVVVKNLDVILKEGDDVRSLFGGEEYASPPELPRILDETRRLAARYRLPLRLYPLQPRESPVCEQNPLVNLFINWEGYVSPCITLAYAQRQYFGGRWHEIQRCRFGDINSEELPQIWQKEEYKRFRAIFQARQETWLNVVLGSAMESFHNHDIPPFPPAPEGCRTCSYLYYG